MLNDSSNTATPGISICGRCGHALPPDGVPGLCPRCELALALEGPGDFHSELEHLAVRGDLGGYEMLEEAGRGGMGSVWKARQPGLGRLVAIKILPGGEWAGASVRLRFQREAEAAARLRHPHLVAVHDCGEHEGTLWYSMDFIEGESLAERIQRQPLAPREAAELIEKVTRAVAFAHGQGVWHRDLKPANILIDQAGEPHVTDFGLAHTEASTGLTVSGHLAGSPHYLPPERARAGNDGTPAAAGDIYALGATLYHTLTGRPPFSGSNVSSILAKVIADPPARPSSLASNIPRDLETVCLKCLEKDPARRYATAEALADDLKRFLDGVPVHARPINAPARTWRWAKRRPALAALGAALVLALAGLLVLFAVSAQRSRTEAERLRLTARAAENAEHTAQIESGLASARSARLSDRFASRREGLESLAKAAAIAAASALENEPTLRALRDEAAALLALPATDFQKTTAGPRGAPGEEVWWIERTRQWLMLHGPAPRGWFLVKADGSVVTELPVPESAFATTCSPDGRYVFTKAGESLSTEGTLWQAGVARATVLRKCQGHIVDWSPDSMRALRADSGGYAVEELATGRTLCRYPHVPFRLNARFSNDGRLAAVTIHHEKSESGAFGIAVIEASSAAELWSMKMDSPIRSVAWNADDTWVASVDAIGQVRTVAAASGYSGRVMTDPGGGAPNSELTCLEFTRDGFLISLGARRTATLWDAASGRQLRTQIASGWHSGGLREGRDFGPLLSRRMPPSWLRVERGVWTSVALPLDRETPPGHLSWSPDSRRLAVAHPDGTWIWDAADRKLGRSLAAPIDNYWCRNAEFRPDNAGLLAAYPGGLWIQATPGPDGNSLALPFRPGALRRTVMARAVTAPLMAVAVEDADDGSSSVIVFRPDNFREARRHPLPKPPTALALSPDGTRLAIGLADSERSLILLDTADFRVCQEWLKLGGAPHALQFDPAGRILAFAVFNAHLADCETGAILGEYSSWSEADGIFGSPTAAFDPSGQWFAVTEPPRRIVLYRRAQNPTAAPAWQSFLTLESPSGSGITRLEFSPNGKHLAAATTRPAVELWDLAALESEVRRLGLWPRIIPP
jgi:WD40 repeat protein